MPLAAWLSAETRPVECLIAKRGKKRAKIPAEEDGIAKIVGLAFTRPGNDARERAGYRFPGCYVPVFVALKLRSFRAATSRFARCDSGFMNRNFPGRYTSANPCASISAFVIPRLPEWNARRGISDPSRKYILVDSLWPSKIHDAARYTPPV
jgi:hypothetical protein